MSCLRLRRTRLIWNLEICILKKLSKWCEITGFGNHEPLDSRHKSWVWPSRPLTIWPHHTCIPSPLLPHMLLPCPFVCKTDPWGHAEPSHFQICSKCRLRLFQWPLRLLISQAFLKIIHVCLLKELTHPFMVTHLKQLKGYCHALMLYKPSHKYEAVITSLHSHSTG